MEEALLSNKKRDPPDGNKASGSGGVPEFVDLTRQSAAAAAADRRHVLSGYAALLHLINERSDEIGKAESMKFMSIMDEFDQMHQFVEKPRDQVRDAEALLGLTGSLEASIRSQAVGGITPADFVSALLEGFGGCGSRIASKHILWKEIGVKVSSIFRNGRGCSTMLGPTKNELKQRKVAVCRKRTIRIRSTKSQPKELNSAIEEKTDTDKNMATMFEILRKKRSVKLENLLLNRKSFAQTVENLFALSFLVKDGRVVIAVDEKGSHLVSPRNAPSSGSVMAKEVVYTHFIFRLDFCDWKLMKDLVPEGDELMPVRNGQNFSGQSQAKLVPEYSQAEYMPKNSPAAIPIKIYSRNRGVPIRGKQVGEESQDTSAGCKH